MHAYSPPAVCDHGADKKAGAKTPKQRNSCRSIEMLSDVQITYAAHVSH